MNDKFDKEARTFETRLLYIDEIFTKKYDQEEILTSCITYKLNKTYEQYVADLNASIAALQSKNKPLQVLQKTK